ncbi:hypothetical protein AMS68_003646 [Peltaster fructicola]|uniref:SigF-like NTF2-like domain-containing protein n=1 Tax=Peltaster fructicola TaxID=286661 RepID=A0A6H0XU34_9PEZI|nr:hypothetical protein AMS68_003646 [Peltaster fructicola]
MDNPEAEIMDAIDLVAAAESAETQLASIEKYFTPDASFLHPLCYVPSSAQSRARLAMIYQCYRGFIPRTSFKYNAVAWNEKSGTLFVDLIQYPELRLLDWFVVPAVPMRIYLHLRKEDSKWRIDRQEDLIQPRSLLLCIPSTRWWAILFWWVCQVMGIFFAHVFAVTGLWSPKRSLKHA